MHQTAHQLCIHSWEPAMHRGQEGKVSSFPTYGYGNVHDLQEEMFRHYLDHTDKLIQNLPDGIRVFELECDPLCHRILDALQPVAPVREYRLKVV